jgi:hypothetical protein
MPSEKQTFLLNLPFELPLVFGLEELEPIPGESPPIYRYLVVDPPPDRILLSGLLPDSPRSLFFWFHSCLAILSTPPQSQFVLSFPQFYMDDSDTIHLNPCCLASMKNPLLNHSLECFPPFECFSGNSETYFNDYFCLYWKFYPKKRDLISKSPKKSSPETWARFYLAQRFLFYLSQKIPDIPLEFTAYLLDCIHPDSDCRPPIEK